MSRRSRSPNSGTRSASPRILGFQAKAQMQIDASTSDSLDGPAIGPVVQHPIAPQPLAPAPPAPWPLPLPPGTPGISEYSAPSSVSSSRGMVEFSPPSRSHNHSESHLSSAINHVSENTQSASSSWQAQNEREFQFATKVRDVAVTVIQAERDQASQLIHMTQQQAGQVYVQAHQAVEHARTEACMHTAYTSAAAAAEVSQA
jgi:hypothetical protein